MIRHSAVRRCSAWDVVFAGMLMILALLGASPSAQAQGFGGASLATVPVSTLAPALGLSPAQQAAIASIQRKYRSQAAPLMPKRGAAPNYDNFQKIGDLAQQAATAISAVLTPEQQQKAPGVLQEAAGFTTVGIPLDVVPQLGLSSAEVAEIATLAASTRSKIRDAFTNGATASIGILRQDALKQALALLAPRQRTTLQAYVRRHPQPTFGGFPRRPTGPDIPRERPIPMASGSPAVPAIHGPVVVGTTPGRPFLFLIPATGQGPLTFSATGLPDGLQLDAETGIVAGSLQAPGTTTVSVTVAGPQGTATRLLTIVGGDHKLALTPPLGWNSWNAFGPRVTADEIRQAADLMVKSGLASHGFRYINIDDGWAGSRAPDGSIVVTPRFGDMKALADYVHSKGLLLGIYSSPGPKTCAGLEGSYRHESQDAQTYAQWGIDYLKYDWCSYSGVAKDQSLPELQKPYQSMGAALDATGRDIIYSLCQYGMGNVWEWGSSVGGNLWRTGGDVFDNWSNMSRSGFAENGRESDAGPGHWNDPDMLVVGVLGEFGRAHSSYLTANEQITQITLWSLDAAPLMIGCDLSKLDKFTTDLLSNDEVLAVDQDPLGKAAGRRSQQGDLEVWSRPLADGTLAVGLFNRGLKRSKVTAAWTDLGLTGDEPVRDLWAQKNLGSFNGSYSARVPAHGAILVKVGSPRTYFPQAF